MVESSWNVMARGDAREGKWGGNWRMDFVASTIHTTSEHGESSITTTDAHTSAASSRLNWCPCWFKWTCLFRLKTKSGFCACAITFQTQSTHRLSRKVGNHSLTYAVLKLVTRFQNSYYIQTEEQRTAVILIHMYLRLAVLRLFSVLYEGWNFNSGNYLFTTDTK